MKRQKNSKPQARLVASPESHDVAPNVVRMLSPAQRRSLDRYEKTCRELGYSRQETKTRVGRLAEAMRDNVRVPTPREKKIRAAIHDDPKAEKEFRSFREKGHPEWAQLARLSEWIGAQGAHPSLRNETMELLVPRDRILSALRYAKGQGLSDAELQKIAPGTWLGELRRSDKGITLKRFKQGDSWRTILEHESKPRNLVRQSNVFKAIRKRIELLGNPAPLQEACRYAGAMSRLLRFSEKDLKDSPLNDFPRVMEDDLLRVAGRHLKRMAYLMAVTWKAIKLDERTKEYLARMLFERLNQRRRRATSKK